MTPAERALLLKTGMFLSYYVAGRFGLDVAEEYESIIAAVEAEAAPKVPAVNWSVIDEHIAADEAKSCETCGFELDDDCTAPIYILCSEPDLAQWKPKTTEADVCPTCPRTGEEDCFAPEDDVCRTPRAGMTPNVCPNPQCRNGWLWEGDTADTIDLLGPCPICNGKKEKKQ